MEKELLFALISTWLLLIGIVPLWRDIIKGRTIPHPFTVGIWTILVGINIYILYENEQFISMIMPAVLFVCLFWETIVGFIKKKNISMNWFDYVCLILSSLCIIYLIIYKNLYYTAIFTAIVDFIAILPTFKKSWLQPWTETAWNFFIGWVSQLFTVLAMNAPDVETMIFWLYILIIDVILVIFIVSRRWYLKWWSSIFE